MNTIEKLGKGNAIPLTTDNAPVYREHYNAMVEKVNEIITTIPTAKTYLARLTEDTGPVMVITEFFNSIGDIIVEYQETGTWHIKSNGKFTEGATLPYRDVFSPDGNVFVMQWSDTSTIILTATDTGDELADGLISNLDIQINVIS